MTRRCPDFAPQAWLVDPRPNPGLSEGEIEVQLTLERHYTPVDGNRLNMAELALPMVRWRGCHRDGVQRGASWGGIGAGKRR